MLRLQLACLATAAAAMLPLAASAKRVCTTESKTEKICTPVKHACDKNGICKPVAQSCTTKIVRTPRCYDDGRK